MGTQVFQTQLIRDFFPPSGAPLQSDVGAKTACPEVEGVELYPEALSDAVMHVNKFFPQMFSILPSILGCKIHIHLQVDVPLVKQGFVRASDLTQKNITIGDLIPNKEGLIRVEDLFKRGVVVSTENFAAKWDCDTSVISLSSAYFSRYREEYWRDVQVSSLLFELQNAQFTPQYQGAARKGDTTSKELFVRSFEEIEFTTKALTCARLKRLSEQQEFDERFNSYSFTYDSFELFYLHQQAVQHSYPYAQFHDEVFQTDTDCPYQGTWAVPFPPPSKDGTLSMEQVVLQKVLTCHLDALYDTQKEYRDQKCQELRERIENIQKKAHDSGKNTGTAHEVESYQNVWKNLQFFQKKYEAYVRFHSPEHVVHLISPLHSARL